MITAEISQIAAWSLRLWLSLCEGCDKLGVWSRFGHGEVCSDTQKQLNLSLRSNGMEFDWLRGLRGSRRT
ncbi:hypothetical protein MHYP_G00174180 [Metynnis hypsauchen]